MSTLPAPWRNLVDPPYRGPVHNSVVELTSVAFIPRCPGRDQSWCAPTLVAILPIADLIQQETGQVVTSRAVIGKMQRIRSERARAELTEDLAKESP